MMSVVDAPSFVFGDGDQVMGDGRVVRDADGDWFEPWLPVLAIGWGPGRQPPPERSEFAVPIVGADLDALSDRYERDGVVVGRAAIRGFWRSGVIEVQSQSVTSPAGEENDDNPEWTDPPCPEPSGGWPRGFPGSVVDNLEFDLGDLKESGAAVSVVTFRPSKDRAVLVVAAADVAAVQTHLGPQLPGRLCVVQSRYSATQITDVLSHLERVAESWQAFEWGQGCGEDAQARLVVKVLRVTSEIASWHLAQPEGLVILQPTLAPVGMTNDR